MATFRNRNGKWQVRVRRKGQPAVVKSFQSKQDGERWARQVESDIDKGAYTNLALAERTTLKELIERYIVEVTALSRSAKEDTFRLNALSRDPLAALNVTGLTPSKSRSIETDALSTFLTARLFANYRIYQASSIMHDANGVSMLPTRYR